MTGSGSVPMAATAAGAKVENERVWPLQNAYSDDGGQRFRSIADSIPIDGGQDSDASRTAFRRSRTVAPVDTIIGS
jgi:hypothetical protein